MIKISRPKQSITISNDLLKCEMFILYDLKKSRFPGVAGESNLILLLIKTHSHNVHAVNKKNMPCAPFGCMAYMKCNF